jgi:hypothetical protein
MFLFSLCVLLSEDESDESSKLKCPTIDDGDSHIQWRDTRTAYSSTLLTLYQPITDFDSCRA